MAAARRPMSRFVAHGRELRPDRTIHEQDPASQGAPCESRLPVNRCGAGMAGTLSCDPHDCVAAHASTLRSTDIRPSRLTAHEKSGLHTRFGLTRCFSGPAAPAAERPRVRRSRGA